MNKYLKKYKADAKLGYGNRKTVPKSKSGVRGEDEATVKELGLKGKVAE